jgi:hypothetical protein
VNLRTFTLGALLLLAASSLGFAGERARGNIVEYQGKLYILQPSNNASHATSGTFARGKSQEVFREMVMGAKAHSDLWDKVESIYEVSGTPEQLAALKDLELRWIDVEGTASQTSDELSEDPQKRKIKSLAIDTLHNPTLIDTRQRLRRTWEWESSVSSVGSQTWTFRQDMTFGGAVLKGPGRAELENYMPTILTPPMATVSTRPAVTNGTLLGPRVRVRAFVHRAPSGRHVVALRPLESIADVSGSGMTTVSAPGASLPLPKIGGLPTTAVIVPATPASPVVVSGPGAATPLGKPGTGSTVMGPGVGLPLGKTTGGSSTVPASNPATTPVTTQPVTTQPVTTQPATNPGTTSGPTIVTTPLTKKPGMVGSINP